MTQNNFSNGLGISDRLLGFYPPNILAKHILAVCVQTEIEPLPYQFLLGKKKKPNHYCSEYVFRVSMCLVSPGDVKKEKYVTHLDGKAVMQLRVLNTERGNAMPVERNPGGEELTDKRCAHLFSSRFLLLLLFSVRH